MKARRVALAVAALIAATAAAAPTAAVAAALAAPAAAAAAAAPARAAPGDHVDRVVADRRIAENSGFAASRRFKGVLWTIEDSGNPPVVSGIDQQGHTAARLTLAGVTNVDWEAIAPITLPGGRPGLAISDTGDNLARRASVVIYVIAEPSRLATARVPVLATIRLTYPDGAGDAEALLADPRNGRLYLVSKDLLGAALYAVPTAAWPPRRAPKGLTRTARLQLLAGLSAPIVTDGAVLADGRVLLRNYGTLYLFPPADRMRATRVGPLAREQLPQEDQGEALAVVDGGDAVLVGGEGLRQPVYRVPLAGLVASAPTAGTTPSRAATSSPGKTQPGTTRPGSTQPGKATSSPSTRTAAALGPALGWGAAAAAGILAVVSGLALLGRRRR